MLILDPPCLPLRFLFLSPLNFREVTNVGLVAKTKAPEPVSSVTAAAKLALEGVANHVATPVPKPVMDPTAGVTVVLLAKVN